MNPSGTISDTALVLRVGRWDQDALAQLYARHGGVVFGLARRVLADSGAAEQIVQEVFLRLWNHPETFDPGRGSLRSFLVAQAHNRAVDLVRSETARHKRELRHVDQRATHDAIDDQVSDLIVAEQVRGALRTLPDDERRAIEMAYFGGNSYREVAMLLDTPEGTVKSRIRSGLRRLRAHFEDMDIGVSWLTK